jgi:DNA-binding MarR family transcriptional regulator
VIQKKTKKFFNDLFQIGVSLQHLSSRLEMRCGISLAQWTILQSLIDSPTASALSLAQRVGIQPSTLTQSLKRLERKKWILIAKDPKDSRKKMLSLTRLGKEILDESSLQMQVWFKNHQYFEKNGFDFETLLVCLNQIQ